MLTIPVTGSLSPWHLHFTAALDNSCGPIKLTQVLAGTWWSWAFSPGACGSITQAVNQCISLSTVILMGRKTVQGIRDWVAFQSRRSCEPEVESRRHSPRNLPLTGSLPTFLRPALPGWVLLTRAGRACALFLEPTFWGHLLRPVLIHVHLEQSSGEPKQWLKQSSFQSPFGRKT